MIQDTIKALSDPSRRKILELLKKKNMTRGEILRHFDMTGATLSHHLSILKKRGLVQDTKVGTFVYYEINTTVIEDVLRWLTSITNGTEENPDEKNG